MRTKRTIGKAELELLQFIADRGGASVGEAAQHLADTKGQTRNTALNVMERLRVKGFLRREKQDGIYRYTPVQTKGNLLQGLIQDFVDTALGGSMSPLVAYLAERVEAEDQEVEHLRRLVAQLEGGEDAG